MKLREGMRSGDLADIVLPLISVDEYESKVDEKKAIVIGFYVHDEDAANDLNRFLQKCYVSLLDTEVSPAPDQHGYYLVFVELLRDDNLGKNVDAILKDVSPLTEIDDWQMRVRKTDDILDFSPETLEKAVENASKLDETRKIILFLESSDFTQIGFDKGLLVLATPAGQQRFEVVSFGPSLNEELLVNISLKETFRANKLQALLGLNWNVSNSKDTFVLHRNDMIDCLVLKSTI